MEISPCNLTPIFEQDVSSQVDGVFDEVVVDVGHQVRKGDLLGRLDDRQLRAQVELLAIRAGSEAAERIAKAQFDEANAKVEYADKANGTGLRTVPELEAKTYFFQRDRYAFEIKKAREEREAAQKELEKTRVVLQQHEIRAGLAGEIVKVYKRPGEAVRQAEQVFRVANFNSLRVEGLCKIQQANLIRVGMRALVEPEMRGEQMTELVGHTGAITALAISADGRLLASASEDRSVLLWNWPEGTRHAELLHNAEVTAVAFLGSGGDDCSLLTGCGDGQVRLWKVRAVRSQNLHSLTKMTQQHEGPVRAVAFSVDGTRFATGGEDRRIGIWETATGKLLFWLCADEGLSAHQGSVAQLRFCPDGRLVSAGRDQTVKVWKLSENTGSLLRVHAGRTCEVSQLGVSPEGQRVLLDLGEELRILNRDSGSCLGSLHSRRQGRFQALASFSPTGRLVLTASSNMRLQLWSVPPAAEETQFFRQGYAGSGGLTNAKAIVWGPDGNAYVSSYYNSEVIRFNGTTGAFINVFASGSGGFEGLTFGPNGNLFVASYGNNAVYQYNGTTGASLGTFASGSELDNPYGLSFDPAGNLDVASRTSGTIATFSGTSGAFLSTLASGLTNPAYLMSGNSSVYGQSVTFTATVSAVAPATGTPTGTVTFVDGTTDLATISLSGGTAVFTTTAFSVGGHDITVDYPAPPPAIAYQDSPSEKRAGNRQGLRRGCQPRQG